MESINKMLEFLTDNEKTGGTFQGYTLDNIRTLLKLSGNPQKKIKTIHIAGTNGKGSVAHMLNSILIAAGLKTGLYTSPHLVHINERIRVGNREIPNSRLIKYINDFKILLKKNPKLNPTYFDALTLFALRYFYDENVDIAVIETGLGGRLDSTNVVSPDICVITDISLDHIHILGETVQEIAAEKAGIIKKETMVVTSNENEKILEILKKKSEECKAELYAFNKDFFAKKIIRSEDKKTGTYSSEFDFLLNLKDSFLVKQSKTKEIMSSYFSLKNVRISMPGKFQIKNSSLAIAAALLLGKSGMIVRESDVKKGLNNLKVPGRLQVLLKKPLIIFDPAHNPAALNATLTAIKDLYPRKKYYALMSFMIDKDYLSMFRIVKKFLSGKVFYYELNDERCFKPSGEKGSRKSIFNNMITVNNFKTLFDNMVKFLKPDSLLLITGSFRLFTIAQKLGRSFSKEMHG